ncbi:hypothetical protein FSP39_007871 [Pinctada imbricata]|uniref:Parathion hydrolase-related protein n=1 Tax=Pinctada imbricata TaxID=66713 RepID=A0AA88XXT7_PINIB|nr:hypothetical protein FSP39_007871 [Pinctada imbricata]
MYTDQQVSLDNLWFVNQNPYGCLPNLRLCDENEAVIEEIKFFKKHGGGTIVENTTTGIKRDVEFYQRVAKEAGVNVIAGTGYYVEKSRPDTLKMTEEEMVENMRTDILHGADSTNIRCGIVGEIGCSWPLTASEKTCVKASATVQSELRCPVMVHPGRNEAAPFEIIRIYQEAGGDVNKLIMGHLDRTIFNREKLVDFASIGSYCEYDLFGIELSYYQIQDTIDMPSDAQRIQLIKYLIDEGFEDQITIAHDIHTKHRLMKYGGHGYSHILLNVLPKMRKRGITQEHINKMLKENPRKWLTFGK